MTQTIKADYISSIRFKANKGPWPPTQFNKTGNGIIMMHLRAIEQYLEQIIAEQFANSEQPSPLRQIDLGLYYCRSPVCPKI